MRSGCNVSFACISRTRGLGNVGLDNALRKIAEPDGGHGCVCRIYSRTGYWTARTSGAT